MTRTQHLKSMGLRAKKRPKQIIYEKTVAEQVEATKKDLLMALKRRFSKKKKQPNELITTETSVAVNENRNLEFKMKDKLISSPFVSDYKDQNEINTEMRQRSVSFENIN